jgi:hypothetical protein
VNRPDRVRSATLPWAAPSDADADECANLSPADKAALIDELMALVTAIDQRVPHIDRIGEHRIAQDAAELKARALERVARLRAGCG